MIKPKAKPKPDLDPSKLDILVELMNKPKPKTPIYLRREPAQQAEASAPPAPPAERAKSSADFRDQCLVIAQNCTAELMIRPDRGTSAVLKDVMGILNTIEQQTKVPEMRPEDVLKGAKDFLSMLPELCSQDDELRELALETLKTL